MYTVYSLVDQRNDASRYVGITDDVYKRFFQHVQCNGNNLDKNDWIQSLKDEGLMLIMKTLEVVDTVEEAREREQYWIHYYLREGASLLNQYVSRSFTYDDFLSAFGGKSKPLAKPKVILPPARGEAQQKALRIIRRNPDIRVCELAKKAQISKSYASKILSEMA